MTAQEARQHLRYSGWASKKLLDACMVLPPEEQTKARSISHGTILGTLGHIYFADRIWYQRTVDPSTTMPPMAEMSSTDALTRDWPELQGKWELWADSLSDSDLERVAKYTFTDGRTGETPVSQILLHVVNHATLHRGQLVAMLRQIGLKPPATDFIFYLRELAAAAKV